jgi:hypothetical protein
MNRLVAPRFVLPLAFLGFTFAALGQPYLILHDFYIGPRPTPAFIRDNLAYLDGLPFDGLAVYIQDKSGRLNVTGDVFSPTPMSYEGILTVLTPIAQLQFRNIKQNFGLMFAGAGVDVFDDGAWFVREQNLRNFSLALKNAGLKGIFFDNENYRDWAHYGGKGCAATHTLTECQNQMRARGRQVMKALVSQFPSIVVVCLIGPWVSDNTFYERTGLNNIANANELSGPFFTGLVEAKGNSA